MSNFLQTVSTFEFKVNGEVRTVEAPPDRPLLGVLRDLIGLTGTKYDCGLGLCGACTIHFDGGAARSFCLGPRGQLFALDFKTGNRNCSIEIMGGGPGGYISIYAALYRPGVFGKVAGTIQLFHL